MPNQLVVCPGCQEELRVKPEHVGLVVICKKCSHRFCVTTEAIKRVDTAANLAHQAETIKAQLQAKIKAREEQISYDFEQREKKLIATHQAQIVEQHNKMIELSQIRDKLSSDLKATETKATQLEQELLQTRDNLKTAQERAKTTETKATQLEQELKVVQSKAIDKLQTLHRDIDSQVANDGYTLDRPNSQDAATAAQERIESLTKQLSLAMDEVSQYRDLVNQITVDLTDTLK